ncbi:MAG: diguanylate cyclase [Tepidisphaeraceae bacterium]|jgi:diguanylate cyclase (GGDEF)-like protein
MLQKLLVIDDSESIHALLRVRLRDECVEIFSALDGPAGLEMAKQVSPDLVFLDVDMPVTNGFAVCQELKLDALTTSVPVIFLTGASSTDEKIRGLDAGAIDYITKPFDAAELRARVRAGLRTKFLLDLLSKKAMIDGLTGLWNRAYFDQRLAAETSLAERSGHPLSVVMADIDYFKRINDRFGHPCGDEVLRTAGQLLTESCRKEEVVCRYGGEEFAVVVPNSAIDDATGLAGRFNRIIASHEFVCRGVRTPLTCSFGVAELARARSCDVVELADQALYRAKQNGRNRVEANNGPATAAA